MLDAGSSDGVHARFMRALARRAGFRAFRFFARPLDPDSAIDVREGIELRMLGEQEVVPLCARAELDLGSAKVLEAYARGDICAGAFNSGELVGYCWFAFAPLHHLDGVWVDFHREGAWMYKSLVLPSQRGRGIAPALYRFADRWCRDRGRKFSISCIETHNRPSIAAILRSGYVAAGYGGYLRRGARLFPWSARAAQGLSVNFYIRAPA